MRKETAYTKIRHYASKPIEAAAATTGEGIAVELLVGILMAGLSWYGYRYGFLPLFLLSAGVAVMCFVGIGLSIYQFIDQRLHKKRCEQRVCEDEET